MKKMVRVSALILPVVASLALLAGACENFMSGGKQLKDAIRQEVAESNAPTVQITVRAQEDSMGTTSPLGSTLVRVGIPFNIATTVSSEFGFVSWVQEGGSPGDITFADASRTETQATVMREVGGLGIRATFSDRPVVTSTSPFDNEQSVVITRPVRITFSKEIDIASVTDDTIHIQRRLAGSTAAFTPINDFFVPPTLSGTTLTYSLRDGYRLGSENAFFEVLVTITTGVRDLQGKSMSASRTVRFVTSREEDANDPIVSDLVIKSAVGVPLPPGNYTTSPNIILDFDAYDLESIELRAEISDDLGNILYNDIHFRNLPVTLTDSDRANTITIVVFDLSNRKSNELSPIITLDRQPPNAPTLSSGPDPGVWTNAVNITVTATDNGPSGIGEYRIISGVPSPIPSASGVFNNVIPSVQGVSTLRVMARDRAGHEGPALDVLVRYDSIPPTTPSIQTDNSPYKSGGVHYYRTGPGVTFAFTSSDTGSGVTGFTTNSSGAGAQPELTLAATATVYAVDVAGNVSAGLPVTVQQDITPPVLGSIGAPSGPGIFHSGSTYFTTGTSLTFNPSATDAGSGLQGYSLDDGATIATLPLVLSHGASYTITAVDNLGNTASWPTFTITRDIDPPTAPDVATIVSGHLRDDVYYYRTGGVTLTFTSDDTGSGVAGFTTNSSGAGAQSQVTLTGNATVYAVDRVGNVSAGLPISVQQDTTPPVLGSIGAPSGAGIFLSGSTYYTTGTSLTFNPTATDAGSGLRGYRVNGGTLISDPNPSLILNAGASYTITAEDNVGNTAVWDQFTITQDNAPPVLILPTGTGNYGTGFPLPITDGGSGANTDTIVVARSPTGVGDSWSSNPPNYHIGSESVTNLDPLDPNQEDFIRVTVSDNVGNERVAILRRQRGEGDDSYQITEP